MFRKISGDKIKIMGKSIETRFYDEFKSIFKILITLINRSVLTLKIEKCLNPFSTRMIEREKIMGFNPLKYLQQ